MLQLCSNVIFTIVYVTDSIFRFTQVYLAGEGYMSISSWIINLHMNSKESCSFCIVLKA